MFVKLVLKYLLYLAANIAVNPLGVLAYSCINRVIPRMTAPFTPADHALQEPPASPILTHDWSTTICVARVYGA